MVVHKRLDFPSKDIGSLSQASTDVGLLTRAVTCRRFLTAFEEVAGRYMLAKFSSIVRSGSIMLSSQELGDPDCRVEMDRTDHAVTPVIGSFPNLRDLMDQRPVLDV